MPTPASGQASAPPPCTAPTSTPIATASSAGRRLRTTRTLHQTVARNGSARGRMARNFHSGRARRRAISDVGMRSLGSVLDPVQGVDRPSCRAQPFLGSWMRWTRSIPAPLTLGLWHMPLRELDETVGRLDRGRCLRLSERLERHAASEAVRVAGRHIVLIEDSRKLAQVAQLGRPIGVLRDESHQRMAEHRALAQPVGDRLDRLPGRLLCREARLRVEPLAEGDTGKREVVGGLPPPAVSFRPRASHMDLSRVGERVDEERPLLRLHPRELLGRVDQQVDPDARVHDRRQAHPAESRHSRWGPKRTS